MPLVPVNTSRGAARRKVARTQANALDIISAPSGGLNFRDTFVTMPLTDAVELDNFICGSNGSVLRGGYREWCTSVIDGADVEVAALMAYVAGTGDADDNRLFAAVGEEIYDVTDSSATPAISETVAGANGYWVSTQFANSAGGQFLCAVGTGGYWTYDATTGWTDRTAAITGGPGGAITSIAVFKKRLWFTFAGASAAYYLPIDSVQGALTAFDFGPELVNGGYPVAISNWTQDGGENIQDYFVLFGSEGNIVVYSGYDPSDASNWQKVGGWLVGRFPARANFFTKVGSDLWALCENGIVPISSLVAGRMQTVDSLQNPITGKIQNALNPAMVASRESTHWEVQQLPQIGCVMLKEPMNVYGTYRQWIMSLTTGGWSTFSDLPMNSVAQFGGILYFGTKDGKVCQALSNDFLTDGETIDGEDGSNVEGTIQAAFNPFGTPGNLKTFGMARTIFIGPSAPSVAVQINTQFNFSTIAGSPGFVPPTGARWDISLWNQAYWAGGTGTFEAWVGLMGMGYYGSLRMAVRGEPGTIYTASHIMYEPGGLM